MSGRVVVVLSGGMDSTTLLYDVDRVGYNVYPISFAYGQRHSKEIDAAVDTCIYLGLEQKHKVVDLGVLSEVAPSALTREDAEIPKGHYQEESMKQTVVPNRNMVMLSLAVSYAISLGAETVWYGAHSGDHAIYPDCRPEFVFRMSKVIEACNWSEIQLRVPYLHWSKLEILRRGLELEVDYGLTWTCYEGREKACGRCGACIERAEAFNKAGIQDPIEYEGDR